MLYDNFLRNIACASLSHNLTSYTTKFCNKGGNEAYKGGARRDKTQFSRKLALDRQERGFGFVLSALLLLESHQGLIANNALVKIRSLLLLHGVHRENARAGDDQHGR